MERFQTQVEFAKTDRDLGLVFGWAQVNKVDGKEYIDTQGDAVDDFAMIEAFADFMTNSREVKAMHKGGQRGDVVFCFPMTEGVAKAYGIDTGGKYGALVAIRGDEDLLNKFDTGEYTGFSIGGFRIEDEDIEA